MRHQQHVHNDASCMHLGKPIACDSGTMRLEPKLAPNHLVQGGSYLPLYSSCDLMSAARSKLRWLRQ